MRILTRITKRQKQKRYTSLNAYKVLLENCKHVKKSVRQWQHHNYYIETRKKHPHRNQSRRLKTSPTNGNMTYSTVIYFQSKKNNKDTCDIKFGFTGNAATMKPYDKQARH